MFYILVSIIILNLYLLFLYLPIEVREKFIIYKLFRKALYIGFFIYFMSLSMGFPSLCTPVLLRVAPCLHVTMCRRYRRLNFDVRPLSKAAII